MAPRKRIVARLERRWTWQGKEAFGDSAPNQNPDASGVFRFDARFPGQWADTETGLFYNGFRDYDPRTGRYVQSDPIGLGGGWNTYGYVGGRPVSKIDALGMLIGSPNDPNSLNLAIDHLEKIAPGYASQIKLARDSKDILAVVIVNDGRTYFQAAAQGSRGYIGTIFWDPTMGLGQYNSCGEIDYQPASFGLGHEIVHAMGGETRTRLGQLPDAMYGNREEERVITEYDNPAAALNGYFQRFHHKETPYTFRARMTGITNTEPAK